MVHQLPQVSKCFFKRCFGNHCNFTWHLLWLLRLENPEASVLWDPSFKHAWYTLPFSWFSFALLQDTYFSLIQLRVYIILFTVFTAYFISSTVLGLSCITDLCGYLCLKMCIFWEINAIFSHQKKNQFLRVTSMSAWRLWLVHIKWRK